jgi:hypothetical protein
MSPPSSISTGGQSKDSYSGSVEVSNDADTERLPHSSMSGQEGSFAGNQTENSGDGTAEDGNEIDVCHNRSRLFVFYAYFADRLPNSKLVKP